MRSDDARHGSSAGMAVAAGCVVVLVSLFLPWWGYDTVAGSIQSNGFADWGWLTFLSLLGVAALWAIRTFPAGGIKLPELAVPDATVYIIGGALEVAGAVLFWLGHNSGAYFGFASGVKFGAFIAIVGGALTIAGGYLLQARQPGGSGAAAGPPPT